MGLKNGLVAGAALALVLGGLGLIGVFAIRDPQLLWLPMIGVGIAESDRDKIFNLFYTQPVGDCGSRGTGLGLAISRAMIEAHGGRIWAFSGPNGNGTCMRISLPLTLNSPEV